MKESKVYDQIVEEGRLESRRENILAAVEIRFGLPAAKEFAPEVIAVTDNNRLARVLRLARRCSTLEQYRDRFPKSAKRPQRKR